LGFLSSRQFELVYPDGRAPGGYIKGVDYRHLLSQLTLPEKSERLAREYPFEIGQTTDDKPFFHYFLKVGKLKAIYHLMGSKWAYFMYEGMALPFILVFLVVVSTGIFVVTFFVARRREGGSENLGGEAIAARLAYFALIGFAFTFAEVYFIQKFILPLVSPVSAFAVTVLVLLLSSGAGSFLSGYGRGKYTWYAMATVPALLVLYFFLFEEIIGFRFSPVALIPLGIGLGFFFPAGLRLLSGHSKPFTAIAYAINGAASVIAPPLASVVALGYGLRVLLGLAALGYVSSLFLLGFSGHRHKDNAA